MKTDTEVPLVPFLVMSADRPVEDSVAETESYLDKEQATPLEWFHTRCGHPRARDD